MYTKLAIQSDMTKENILNVLKNVKHSNLDKDIISMAMLKYLKVEGSNIDARLYCGKDEAEGEKTIAKAQAVLKEAYPQAQISVILLNENPDDKAPSATKEDTLKSIKFKIAVSSGKGGVGKSTVAINLARAFSRIFDNVLLLDCDFYGPSVNILAGEKARLACDEDGKILPIEKDGVKMVSMGMLIDERQSLLWRGPMVMSALKQFVNDVDWGNAEIMILDLPPGTGDAVLSAIQLINIDGAVIVSTPNELSSLTTLRGADIFLKTDIPILGLVENMSYLEMPDGSKNYIFGQGASEKVCDALDIDCLAKIAIDQSLQAFNAETSAKSISAFDSIAQQIITKLNK